MREICASLGAACPRRATGPASTRPERFANYTRLRLTPSKQARVLTSCLKDAERGRYPGPRKARLKTQNLVRYDCQLPVFAGVPLVIKKLPSDATCKQSEGAILHNLETDSRKHADLHSLVSCLPIESEGRSKSYSINSPFRVACGVPVEQVNIVIENKRLISYPPPSHGALAVIGVSV